LGRFLRVVEHDDHNPQLEDGYTRIANEWLEAFAVADYPASIMRFVIVVARETWGYNRKEAPIPIEKLREYFPHTSSRIYQMRDDCLRHNLIEVEDGDEYGAPIYRIQKRYTDWLQYTSRNRKRLHTFKDALVKHALESSEPTFKGVLESTTKGVLDNTSMKDSSKDMTSKDSPSHDFDFDDDDTGNGTTQRLFEVETDKPAKREDTPEQACIRRVWNAHGFDTTPKGAGYAALMKIIQEHGIPLVDEWAAIVRIESPHVPEGADPWKWFCTRMRDAFKAVWKWHADGGGADARERERREFDKPGWTSPSRNHPKVGGVYVHGVGVIPAKASPGVGEMDPGAESDS
jgi:hypothetical protein